MSAVLAALLAGALVAPVVPGGAGAAGAARVADPIARLSSIRLPAGARVHEALTRDVDLDGVSDLVLVAHLPGPPALRRLSLHLRRATGPAFLGAPDATLDLTADVIAFACADVTLDPGCEVVLFNATGAFAWRRGAPEEARIEKLFACPFLWQFPDSNGAFHWQAGVVDLDADGLDDLVLPVPGGYRIALQRRSPSGATFSAAFDLTLPQAVTGPANALVDTERAEVRQPGGRHRVSFSLGSGAFDVEAGERERGPLLRIADSVPAVQCTDWDADGDLDALALSARVLHVFLQEPRGVFDPARKLELESPVVADRQRRLDVSYSARALDLDRDARADCVFFAGDKRAKDVRTQVLVYLQDIEEGERSEKAPTLFGADAAPDQLLVIGGFARPLRSADVDGDGRLDLVAGSVQPDLIDELRAAATERIQAQLYVYKSQARGFSKRPDLTHAVAVSAKNRTFAADFVGDVTGDGTAELLLREEPDRLRLYRTRRTREGLAIDTERLWELAVDPEARLLLPGKLAPGSWDLWVIEKEQVTCASFR